MKIFSKLIALGICCFSLVAHGESTHYYSFAQDGEYGYERAGTEADEMNGVGTKPLVMVRYMGKTDGYYTADVLTDEGPQRMACKSPCDFVTVTFLVDGLIPKREIYAAHPDTIMYGVMQDAMNGQLKVFDGEKARSPVSGERSTQLSSLPANDAGAPNQETQSQPNNAQYKTSFDCKKAALPDEKVVCANPTLAALDLNMAANYRLARGIAKNPKVLRESQESWLRQRHTCGSDIECLRKVYVGRIKELSDLQ